MCAFSPLRCLDKGGRKYQAAALGVQQEVEDIRSELVKLLRTLNTTNAGILGAEHELQKKVRVQFLCGWNGMAQNAPELTQKGLKSQELSDQVVGSP